MNNLKNKWWLAGTVALAVASFLGARAVMAQETVTPEATTQAQETPSGDETPKTDATPSGKNDGEGRREHAGGCGKFIDSEALAGFLGITADELRTELQADGATLASVAAAHGQDRDALKAFLTQEATAALAERVAAGDLTQEEADEKLAEFTAKLDETVDSSGLGRGFRGGRGGPRMGEESSDAPSS